MKSIALITLVLTSLTSSIAFTGQHDNRKGLEIIHNFPANDKAAFKEGQTTSFTGRICASRYHPVRKKMRCYKIKDKKLSIRAYFPDATTEVTNQVEIVNDGNEIKYKFNSPQLLIGEVNSFKLTVGKKNQKIDRLQRTQAKLNKRIIHLEKKIERYKNKPRHDYLVRWLTKYANMLRNVSYKISLLIENNPDILAQINIPVLVGNQISSPLYYSSFFNGHKISLEASLGAVIDGGSTKTKAKSINLSHLSFWFPTLDGINSNPNKKTDGQYKYQLKYSFNNNDLETPFENLPFGQSLSHSQLITGLKSSDINNIKVQLNRERTYKFRRKEYKKIYNWGNISSKVQVAKDTIKPQWSDLLPIDENTIYSNAPKVSVTLEDLFGTIKEDSLKFLLTGVDVNGSNVQLDITNSLSIIKESNNARYLIETNMPALEDGSYEVALYAEDISGNTAIPVNLTKSFKIDSKPPLLTITAQENFSTANSKYVIKASVVDVSQTNFKILRNNVELFTSISKNIETEITLLNGINSFEIIVTDASGLSSSKNLTGIMLDTSAPVLSSISPDNNIITNTRVIGVTASSNEPLSKVLINGNELYWPWIK